MIAVVALAGVMFGLGRLAIINSERRDAEKKRGDLLQKSVDRLRTNQDEQQKFFEIIRQLLTVQGAAEKQALQDELKNFKFTAETTSTTTTVPKKKSTTTTTTTPTSSSTSAPRPPPSTTTTTQSPNPPPTTPCITTPINKICVGSASRNGKGGP